MEGETRANLNYLDQIQKFHRLQGKPIHKIPQLDKRPIDLYRLKKEVAQKGGYLQVTQQKKWAEIGRVLGYTRRQCTSMSNALKNAYNKVILPYESWLEKQKERSTPISLNIKDNMTNDNNAEDDDDAEEDDNNSEDSNQNCEICQKDDKADELLLCDDCDRGYHMSCLSPPLTSIPPAEWYCIKCLTAAGSDYGFEDGDEYSLADFQTFCDDFKKAWFSKYNPVLHANQVSEEDCEEEFWRLVDDPHETCQVEYGADLHSTQHGSGFASAERNMDNGKRNIDPWNLNMIPILPDSLFTHIKTDISGMMVPWLYIGMCFTTFCWHNEDHYTYSINYMHWGETKTWYGIPGGDTAKFEETMKKAVPELFEQDPNLLFRLVTMLSPGRLLKENVKVYAVDQRPGEFVVTFPKAYHSGFNHGFNFCEAVNFAPDDWVDYGLECVKRYKEYRHQPCFSHDELLVTTAKMDLTQKNAHWLKYALHDMQQREMNDRNRFKKKHTRINITLDNSLNNESQCLNCHCYTYLSYIICPCTKKVSCLDHIEELCACDDTKRTLCLRFSDKELLELVEMAREVANAPSEWNEKARQMLSSGNLPNVDIIKKLLKAAEKDCVTEDETRQLASFLIAIEKWEKEASTYFNRNNDTILKPLDQGEQQLLKYDSKIFNQYDDIYNTILKNKKRYQHLVRLINESENMAFDSMYIPQLKQLLDNIHQFKKDATELLKNKDDYISILDLQRMYYRGLEFQMKIDEIDAIKSTIQQYRWIHILEPATMSLPLDYDAITELVKEAEKCKLPAQHPKYKAAVNKARLGEGWLKHAQRLLPNGTEYELGTMEDLDEVLNVDQDVPTQRDIYQELQGLRVRASEFFEYFNRTIMQCQQYELLNRPIANDIQQLLMQMEQFPPAMVNDPHTLLKNELNRHDAWTNKLKRLFTHRINSAKALGSILQETKENVQNILSHHHQKKKKENSTTTTSQLRKSSDAYCLCHEPESGFMVNCDHCQDWYHGSCVKVTRKQINALAFYVCPVCDPPHDIVETSSRPSLEDLIDTIQEANDFLFVPTVYSLAKEILDMTTSYRDDVRSFCRSKTKLDHNDIYMIKQYLRELLGLQIMLVDETEFLSRKVRELSPITPHHQNQQHTSPSLSPSSPPSSSTSSSHRPIIKLTINPPLIPQQQQSLHDTSSLLDKKRKLSIDDPLKRKSKRETAISNYSSSTATATNTYINNNDVSSSGNDNNNNLQNTSPQPFRAGFYY
ncbi:unnamed protein product [Cunninghamella echinulata]